MPERFSRFILLVAVVLAMALSLPCAVLAARSSFYERDGDFLLFQGSDQASVTAIVRHRIIYTETPSPRYETEALFPDGSWVVVNQDNGDRLLEIQTFNPKMTFQLETALPLFDQPSDHERYSLNRNAEPNLYMVGRKAYDFVELSLADGSTGWIRLPENTTDRELVKPGHFIGQLKTLDERISRDLTVKTEISPAAARAQTDMVPEYVTVHNASNFEDYADAEWHAYQLSILTYTPGVTYHYVVDDKEAFHLTPLNEVTYHAGDRFLNGNGASVAIEICDYANGRYYPAAEVNGAKLAASVLYQLGLPKENLRFHRDWNGKECPLSMIEQSRGSVGLEAFVELVYAEYETLVLTYGQPERLVGEPDPASAMTRPVRQRETFLRESLVRETDVAGAEVTRYVMESVEVPDRSDYGALPWIAGGIFVLTVAGGIVYSVRRSKDQGFPLDP